MNAWPSMRIARLCSLTAICVSPLLVSYVAFTASDAAPVTTRPTANDDPQPAPSLFKSSRPSKGDPASPVDGGKATVGNSPTQPAVNRLGPASLAKQPAYVMRLDVVPKAGQDLETAYYEYLNKHRVHPKVMRAKVRRIMNDTKNEKRFDEVVAILRSALRTGQLQPWMYEALGLAMRMNNASDEDVERTLMSAADFATHPQQLVLLADFFDRLGLQARALKLLMEASKLDSGSADAYQRGLQLATRLKDDAAIQWATTGILRHTWRSEQRHVREDARRTALALLQRMRKDGQQQEANQFAGQLKTALQRDIIVKVTWSGDADVDVEVEEPSGTVCSYRMPRTAAGGVLVGDTGTSLSKVAGDGFSESYVCGEGFPGSYRILVRQVWGRIAAGKVAVDVWTNIGSDKAQRYRKFIPIGDNGAAMINFELSHGRRMESLRDAQVVSDVKAQEFVGRAILGQQLNAIASDRAIAAQQIANQQQQPFVIGNTPVVNNGAVGFRPEVVLLPSGATMSVNAVISADRRYVRITALPLFSNIGPVSQFNLSTGLVPPDGDVGVDVGHNLVPPPVP